MIIKMLATAENESLVEGEEVVATIGAMIGAKPVELANELSIQLR